MCIFLRSLRRNSSIEYIREMNFYVQGHSQSSDTAYQKIIEDIRSVYNRRENTSWNIQQFIDNISRAIFPDSVYKELAGSYSKKKVACRVFLKNVVGRYRDFCGELATDIINGTNRDYSGEFFNIIEEERNNLVRAFYAKKNIPTDVQYKPRVDRRTYDVIKAENQKLKLLVREMTCRIRELESNPPTVPEKNVIIEDLSGNDLD